MVKLGLLVEGGGMRGIYGSGVLDLFLRYKIEFDYCIGVSSGAANLASFLAKQEKRTYRYFTQHSFDQRYMSLSNYMKTKSFFGLDYIYETLTNEIDPIDYDNLLSTKSKFVVVATNAKTGKAKYFNNSDFSKNNCSVLKASCALPVICKPIEIDGILYFDGGVTDPIPVKTAVRDGCDIIVAVLSKPSSFNKEPQKMRHTYTKLLKKYPNSIDSLDSSHTVYRESIAYLYKLEREGKAIIICPSETIGVSIASKNQKGLNALYKLGIKDAEKALKTITAFR